jgi:hypothetical protein
MISGIAIYQYFTIYRWYFVLKYEHFNEYQSYVILFKIRRYQRPFEMGKNTWSLTLIRKACDIYMYISVI